jgi:hypothetical protein
MQMIMHSPPANRALIGYKDANDYAFSLCNLSSHWLRGGDVDDYALSPCK